MHRQTYQTLLSQARRFSRRADEAEDLLQTVLLAAIEAGRNDLSNTQNQRWLYGALRNRAAFEARSAYRRRARETASAPERAPLPEHQSEVHGFLTALPPSLRTTALLALTGHTRPEIRYLLRLSDATLRQRIAQIKRRWEGGSIPDLPGLQGHLPFGAIRHALRRSLPLSGVHLGSHDPDGHLFVLSTAHKTPGHGNR